MGMAYLDFARRNPEDVAIITTHQSVEHGQAISTEHRRLEEVVTGAFAEGVTAGVFHATGAGDTDVMAYGAWALVQGLATFEQQQRPALAARVRGKQRRLLQVFVNGLKEDWSGDPEGSPGDESRSERRES
jgi:hypothetical protein